MTRVFFACTPSKQHVDLLHECEVERMLYSYHFIKDVNKFMKLLEPRMPKCIILDSGAFSVWSNGGTVDIDKYAAFAIELRDRLPEWVDYRVVNLDVLPGKFGERPTDEQREESARQGWENMIYLESKGLKVIHVFHQHEDFSWLRKMMEHSDYIGISPANDLSQAEKNRWLDKCFAITRDKIKTHGFAVTSAAQLYKYPFFSVDSSSWTAPARFGRIPIFREDLTIGSFSYREKDGVIKNWDYIKHIGIETLGADSWVERTRLAIKTYQQLEKVATKLWTSRGVIWE